MSSLSIAPKKILVPFQGDSHPLKETLSQGDNLQREQGESSLGHRERERLRASTSRGSSRMAPAKRGRDWGSLRRASARRGSSRRAPARRGRDWGHRPGEGAREENGKWHIPCIFSIYLALKSQDWLWAVYLNLAISMIRNLLISVDLPCSLF